MANGSSAVRSLLKDVEINGAVIISKKKLLWMLDWVQDRPGAWKALLDNWQELGLKKELLHALEVYDKIVLTANHNGDAFVSVSYWATGE